MWYLRSKAKVSNDWLSEHIFCGHPGNIPHSINEVKGNKNKILNRLGKVVLTLRGPCTCKAAELGHEEVKKEFNILKQINVYT
ncbi:MAG: hypothetical protein GY777_30580 [Candidatus Brocadiaceae bacterium]|nr:hypothetical protein [Candidatus Brocadiaceae bacterium]